MFALNPNNQNKVTVYFWENPSSQKNGSMDYRLNISFGHVAIETHANGDTQGNYISFFPGQCAEWHKDEPQKCQKCKPHFHTRNQDNLIYGDNPTDQYDLLSLDSNKINTAYNNFKNRDYNWSKLGSGPLAFLVGSGVSKQSMNCAGLVYLLLREGNISENINNLKDRNSIIAFMLFPSLTFTFGIISSLITVDNIRIYFQMHRVLKTAESTIQSQNNTIEFLTKQFYQLKELTFNAKNILKMVLKENNYYQDLADLLDCHVELEDSFKQILLSHGNFHAQYIGWINNGRKAIFTVFLAATSTSLISYGLTYLSTRIILDTITPKSIKKLVKSAKEKEEIAMESLNKSSLIIVSKPKKNDFQLSRFIYDHKYSLCAALLFSAVGMYSYRNPNNISINSTFNISK
jgi:hypothetical protein